MTGTAFERTIQLDNSAWSRRKHSSAIYNSIAVLDVPDDSEINETCYFEPPETGAWKAKRTLRFSDMFIN